MSLERYQRETFEFPGPNGSRPISHDVYHLERPGAPAVIVLHELFGLSPDAIGLGDYLADLDPPFSVFLPILFGRPGKGGLSNAVRALCVRREFSFFVTGQTSPVTAWVRGLAGVAARRAAGRPVGVIGMCLTGGIVFSAVADPLVGAAVASQPSLPFPVLGPLTPNRAQRDLGTSPADLQEAVSSRTPVLMLRYRQDWMCPALRADAATEVFGGVGDARTDPEDNRLQVATGDQITLIEIAGNKHSVLGVDLNPRARTIVAEYLNRHLRRE